MDVRQRIGDMLNRVALRYEEFVIERKGKPLAALVPIERLEQMRQFARRQVLSAMEAQRRAGPKVSAEEAMALALQAQRWARKQAKRTTKVRRK